MRQIYALSGYASWSESLKHCSALRTFWAGLCVPSPLSSASWKSLVTSGEEELVIALWAQFRFQSLFAWFQWLLEFSVRVGLLWREESFRLQPHDFFFSGCLIHYMPQHAGRAIAASMFVGFCGCPRSPPATLSSKHSWDALGEPHEALPLGDSVSVSQHVQQSLEVIRNDRAVRWPGMRHVW